MISVRFLLTFLHSVRFIWTDAGRQRDSENWFTPNNVLLPLQMRFNNYFFAIPSLSLCFFFRLRWGWAFFLFICQKLSKGFNSSISIKVEMFSSSHFDYFWIMRTDAECHPVWSGAAICIEFSLWKQRTRDNGQWNAHIPFHNFNHIYYLTAFNYLQLFLASYRIIP